MKDLSRRHWAKETPTARPLFSAGVFTCRIGASPLFQRAASVWFRGACLVSAVFLIGCGRQEAAAPTSPAMQTPIKHSSTALAGSKTCQECHADFYKLWSTSWHGLAMQPYTAAFAKRPPDAAKRRRHDREAQVSCGGRRSGGLRSETGPDGERKFPIVHVMGGKNVYYLLTPYGSRPPASASPGLRRPQESLVRHGGQRRAAFPRPPRRGPRLDRPHVRVQHHLLQLPRDGTLDELRPGDRHLPHDLGRAGHQLRIVPRFGQGARRAMEAEDGAMHAKDIKIIRTKEFTPAADERHVRHLPCEAGPAVAERSGRATSSSITSTSSTLEHADFYPDGRDLGENYTYTSWLMSPCVRSGKLDCNHCHTPSGRMRFEGRKANQMCMPCHEKEVKQPVEHGHHVSGSTGNECIACHMPMTRFAAMGRTDHSMRSPTPATTVAFKSPNACSMCHADHDAAWADQWARKWYRNDYQAECSAGPS